jgi:hypothetical protein
VRKAARRQNHLSSRLELKSISSAGLSTPDDIPLDILAATLSTTGLLRGTPYIRQVGKQKNECAFWVKLTEPSTFLPEVLCYLRMCVDLKGRVTINLPSKDRFMTAKHTILDVWDITPEFLTKVVRENPSLRGMMLGYIAEMKLREIFERDDRIEALRKDDDHDRKKKGDLVVKYKGEEFKIEVKSLQTNSIEVLDQSGHEQLKDELWLKKIVKLDKRYLENPDFHKFWETRRAGATYRGNVQCDGSDKRQVSLGRGKSIATTNLLVGEFDILAAGLFGFREQWDFGFALNRELPTSTRKGYPKGKLLKAHIKLTWPLKPPFVSDPFPLLDRLCKERRRSTP